MEVLVLVLVLVWIWVLVVIVYKRFEVERSWRVGLEFVDERCMVHWVGECWNHVLFRHSLYKIINCFGVINNNATIFASLLLTAVCNAVSPFCGFCASGWI